jgi:hypothetical protein
MYESPIDLLMSNIQTQIIEQQEAAIYKAVFDIGVNVTKDELLRALAYDRQQYEIGFAEGIAAAKPEWIPATERLPEDASTVLALDSDGTICSAYYVGRWHGGGNLDEDAVTHWMPLPEPPKEVP